MPHNFLLAPEIPSQLGAPVRSDSELTFLQVAHSLVPQLLLVLGRLVQVLEDVDARSKVDHVLLPTAKRHLNQGVQVADGQGQYITCGGTI